ncbi:hypothetical protein ACLEQD_15995, partial [Corallococcus sp. 4LFB]
ARWGRATRPVISAAPASFYALLATERLRELGRTPPAAFPQPPKQLTLPRPPELELAVALTRAGLFRDAADEVRSRVSDLRTADQALPFAHALLQLGEFGHAHMVAARHLWGRAFGAKAPDALAAFYPRASRRRWRRRPRGRRWIRSSCGPSCGGRAPSVRR